MFSPSKDLLLKLHTIRYWPASFPGHYNALVTRKNTIQKSPTNFNSSIFLMGIQQAWKPSCRNFSKHKLLQNDELHTNYHSFSWFHYKICPLLTFSKLLECCLTWCSPWGCGCNKFCILLHPPTYTFCHVNTCVFNSFSCLNCSCNLSKISVCLTFSFVKSLIIISFKDAFKCEF